MTEKEYEALSIAIGVMESYLGNGGKDEDVDKALDEIISLKNKEEKRRHKKETTRCPYSGKVIRKRRMYRESVNEHEGMGNEKTEYCNN